MVNDVQVKHSAYYHSTPTDIPAQPAAPLYRNHAVYKLNCFSLALRKCTSKKKKNKPQKKSIFLLLFDRGLE